MSGVRILEFPSHSREPPSRSHLEELKKIRGLGADRRATETNKLVVRLDLLLQDMPGDPARRREHERGVVDWVDKDLVKHCPSCSRGFNLVRSKHHCRLCGCVMCQQCSQWVDWGLCRKLTNQKDSSSEGRPDQALPNGCHQKDTRSFAPPKPLFRLTQEVSSSVVRGLDLGEEFRSCVHCKQLLEFRDRLQDRQTRQPALVQLYSSLVQHTKSGEELSAKYLRMHASLLRGESRYNLEDAKLLRGRLRKVAEKIGAMSKHIESLGADRIAPELAPRKFRLQEQIRRASLNLINETLVCLPSPPTVEEVVKLQEKRKSEALHLTTSPASLTATDFVMVGYFHSKVHDHCIFKQ